jgi:hypothetical protein
MALILQWSNSRHGVTEMSVPYRLYYPAAEAHPRKKVSAATIYVFVMCVWRINCSIHERKYSPNPFLTTYFIFLVGHNVDVLVM